MALINDNSIPPFPATTLSTNHFRWLQEGDWSDAERAYFLADRRALHFGIFAPPPIFRVSTKPSLKLVGRWVLNAFPQNPDESVGWAEAQILQGAFRTGFLFLGRPGNGTFPALDAWSFLISATFIQWGLDVLRVMPAHMPLSTIAALGGKTVPLWTPRSRCHGIAMKEPVVGLSVLQWEQHQWWESERGRKDRLSLSYLTKRRSKYDEEQRCRCSSHP